MADLTKGSYETEIVMRKRVSPSSFLIALSKPDRFTDAMPGQFVSLRIGKGVSPLLRRPYSIMDITKDSIVLLVRVVGKASAALASGKIGDVIDIIGPLGGSYFEIKNGCSVVFVAGGTGLAPLLFAARKWAKERSVGELHLLYGAESSNEILDDLCTGIFTEVHIATLDGSKGFRGDVVEMFKGLSEGGILPEGELFSCGPVGMVKALMDSNTVSFTDHYTSLEAVMACGVGACRGCVVPFKSNNGTEYKSVCGDGTVFRAEDIDWEKWGKK
ncbi:NAD-dependent dihydroorotate dehydrogenase B electron transfer subunit [bacterium]|nr:NAD-dependent dihydroorotate dehydrogenase B electron transfer subunit [bacterium]